MFLEIFQFPDLKRKDCIIVWINLKKVELDFSGINEIGQGFADELFVKFENTNPEILLTVINANDNVLNMIKHVRKTL